MTSLPKAGDLIECAIWLSGTEPEEMIALWKNEHCPAALRGMVQTADVTLGPVIFVTKRPGEDRVPPVPDHIHGPDVQLLVAEAVLVEVRPLVLPATSFVTDLDKNDLARLRTITRNAYQKHNRNAPRLTDEECDGIIEAMGPQTAGNVISAAANTLH